jgi:hypothetical protein
MFTADCGLNVASLPNFHQGLMGRPVKPREIHGERNNAGEGAVIDPRFERDPA